MTSELASDAEILERIESFRKKHAIAATTFGRNAIGDANLIANLRAGRSLTLKTARSVIEYMATYRPESAAA